MAFESQKMAKNAAQPEFLASRSPSEQSSTKDRPFTGAVSIQLEKKGATASLPPTVASTNPPFERPSGQQRMLPYRRSGEPSEQSPAESWHSPPGPGLKAPSPLGATPAKPTLQAKLKLNKVMVNLDDDPQAFLDNMRHRLTDERLARDFDEYREENEARLIHVLQKWVGAPEHKKISKGDYDRPHEKPEKAKVRSYQTPDDLVRALMGEARSKKRKTDEKAYATEIVQDRGIYEGLVRIVTHVIPVSLMNYGHDLDSLERLAPQNRRTYLEYVRERKETTIRDVLLRPYGHTFGEIVSAIHDVQELLYQSKNEELVKGGIKDESERNANNPHALPADLYRGTVLDDMGIAHRAPVDRAWRGADATPKPSDPHVRTALALDNPTDMGPSMTAARMFVLATAGGANPQLIEILAKSIFAFWNRIYRRDITDIHRYHFTMDMAANFGVNYNPFAEIDRASREKQERFNLRTVSGEFDDSDDDI